MIDNKDFRKLESAMTRAVFRGAFWAVILGGFVLAAIQWLILTMISAAEM